MSDRFVKTPAVDVFENDDAVTVVADMPGVRSEDLEIDLQDNELLLKASLKSHAPEGKRIYAGYQVEGYSRTFALSPKIDQEKISANLANGVLTLTLPKRESMKARRIQVKSN